MKNSLSTKVAVVVILLIFFLILFFMSGYIGELGKEDTEIIVKEGVLASDETWSGFISIPSSVNVPKGVTLTIKPGTHIYFGSDKGYQEPKKGFLVIGERAPLWASHKTCELWDDDKVIELSVKNLVVPT